jgi:Domain of unknown function (DUF4440)
MNRILIVLFTAILISSCKQQDITEQEVMNAINKFDYGWEHKDLKTVDSVLSPKYIYFTQSGGTFSRDSVVTTAGENSYLLERVSRSEFVITTYGNTAVVSTRWKGKGIYRGTPFDEDQRCSVVLVKKDNKVEILSEHCTPVKTNHIFH